MSMYSDFGWGQKGNQEILCEEYLKCCCMRRKAPTRQWSFLGLGSEEKCYGTLAHKPNGWWNNVADLLMINFRERTSSIQRNKGVVPRSFQKANEVEEHRCIVTRTQRRQSCSFAFFSVIQLRVFGARADWCQKLAQQISDHSSLQLQEDGSPLQRLMEWTEERQCKGKGNRKGKQDAPRASMDTKATTSAATTTTMAVTREE